MIALKRVLKGYVDEVVAGGDSPRTEALRAQLNSIQQRNARYFNLAVVMLVTISLTTIAIMASDALHRTALPVGTALVITAIGMVRIMLSLWREKVATEMLIALSELDDGVLKQIVARLLRRLR
jgi:hypothetical protein